MRPIALSFFLSLISTSSHASDRSLLKRMSGTYIGEQVVTRSIGEVYESDRAIARYTLPRRKGRFSGIVRGEGFTGKISGRIFRIDFWRGRGRLRYHGNAILEFNGTRLSSNSFRAQLVGQGRRRERARISATYTGMGPKLDFVQGAFTGRK